MTNPESTTKVTDFNILFDLLEKTKNEQPIEVRLSLDQNDEEVKGIIAMFNEYQNSEFAASFSTITTA